MTDPEGDFRAVVMAVFDGVVVIDAEGVVRFANPAAARVLGRRPDELADLRLGSAVVGAGDLAELDVLREASSPAVVEMSIGPIRWQGGAAQVVTLRDVTERVLAERRLAASEERYALVAQGSNDGLWDWDLETGQFFASVRVAERWGHPPDAPLGDDPEVWFARVHPDDVMALRQAVDQHLAGETARFTNEHRVRRRDGSWLWVLSRGLVVRENGRAHRFAGSLTDISERRKAEEDLKHLALHDPLTGLANRTLFLDRLQSTVWRTGRSRERFAVLLIDLDRFKFVNDTLGHAAGDALLGAVAARIHSCVRAADTVARLGGDEFGVLLGEPLSIDGLMSTVRRIQETMEAPVHVGSTILHARASVGIALVEDPQDADPDQVLRSADLAMYRAKEKGTGSVEISDQAVNAAVLDRLERRQTVQAAVESGDLFMRYQPILDLAEGRIVGVESLMRWQVSPDLVLDAGVFLDVVEAAGTIIPLGWEMLERCCQQVRTWRDAGSEVFVSVNLAPLQLVSDELAARVETALANAGINGSALRLEVTEQGLQAALSEQAGQLARCHELGVGIVVDDFGLGHGGLSLVDLGALPLTAVKIDRWLVGRLLPAGDLDLDRDPPGAHWRPESDTNDATEAISTVKAILAVAGALGLEVVAEGIETPAQRDLLRGLGCIWGQGFLFAPALDAVAATEALAGGYERARGRSRREVGRGR
jgi:diguanylate cyclase (GGDEF)-like protein/PAS domain S-box-containing protein